MMCPFNLVSQIFILAVGLIIGSTIVNAQDWNLFIEPNTTIIYQESSDIYFNLTGPSDPGSKLFLLIESKNDKIATPANSKVLLHNHNSEKWFSSGNFTLNGAFLGYAEVTVRVAEEQSQKLLTEDSINVKVIRKKRVIDTVFVSIVATLVSIIYINFGCALKWNELPRLLKKPIGPAIGCIGQFLIMPLLSFGLGKALFPDSPEMQLGMFFTGVSPGGGASNVWVAVLDGNIDLSITMTAISTLGAFITMPFWLFTLGVEIFKMGNVKVPYKNISSYAIALIVPLFIGFLIQRYCKRLSSVLVRVLKIFSSALILFIIIFAIVVNFYLFQIFSWQIVVAGMGLPWLGYILAYILAKIFKQNSKDSITIAVETGIQNTGIAIFLLTFTLPQPEADITTIIPVYVATMTPIPLLILYLYLKFSKRCSSSKESLGLLENNKSFNNGDTKNTFDMDDTNGNITTIS